MTAIFQANPMMRSISHIYHTLGLLMTLRSRISVLILETAFPAKNTVPLTGRLGSIIDPSPKWRPKIRISQN